MEKVYRSCMTKNADGTNKIIGPGEQCLIPTNNPFWKQPQDIKNCGVKTRSCTKKEAMVSIQSYRNYVEQKERAGQWVVGTEPRIMEKEDGSFVL